METGKIHGNVYNLIDIDTIQLQSVTVTFSPSDNSFSPIIAAATNGLFEAILPATNPTLQEIGDHWHYNVQISAANRDFDAFPLRVYPGTITELKLKDKVKSFPKAAELPARLSEVSLSSTFALKGGGWSRGRLAPGAIVGSNGLAGPTQLKTSADGTSSCPHRSPAQPITDLRLVYSNSYVTGAYADADGPSTLTIRASIEYSSTIYRVTFGGKVDLTLDPGGIAISDPVAVDIPANTGYWSRTYVSGTSYYANKATYRAGSSGGFTATTDLTAPGSGALSTSSSYQYVPVAVIGTTATAIASVAILGDSIVTGIGDGLSSILPGITTGGSDGGWVQRALWGVAGCINLGVSGDSAQVFASQAGHFRRLPLAAGCTHAVVAYGRNDVTASRTLAQIQADLISIWTALYRRGVTAYAATVTPKTASTDTWATVENQTVTANESVRVSLNTWLRAGAPVDSGTGAAVAIGTAGARTAGTVGHPLRGVIDATAAVESATDSGKWMAGYTTDGLHPTATAHAAMATASALSGLTA